MSENPNYKELLEKVREELDAISRQHEEWKYGRIHCNWWAVTGLPRKKKLVAEERRLLKIIENEGQNFFEKKDLLPDQKIQIDPDQQRIITAPFSERILVDGGPGTGKTEVACRRVADLIDQQGVYPDNIRLISFTRAAIHEIRDRIGNYLENRDQRYSVKISTIDSYAYEIVRGYNENYPFTGSYDDSILEAKRLMDNDVSTAEIFERIEHLIIDESQDIFSVRANFLLSFIKKLPKECGVTVFSDNAQAIFEWTTKKNFRVTKNKDPLSIRLDQELPDMFKRELLRIVHRTEVPALKFIFTETRDLVLDTSIEPETKMMTILGQIRERANGTVNRIEHQNIIGCDKCFILYKENREILHASNQINKKPHRIRMSGLPFCIYPWIGACLSEYTDSILDEATFKNLWNEKIHSLKNVAIDVDTAWNLLLNLAADTDDTISMRQLRKKLWPSHPPDIMCTKEIGPGGPIISTIHSSKGREADEVRLMLPQYEGRKKITDEEVRVMFVGATRASKTLKIGEGYGYFRVKDKPPNRRYSPFKNAKRARIQFGCENDLSAQNLGSNMSEEQIRKAQHEMLRISGEITNATMARIPDSDFRYHLKSENGTILADITEGPLKDDMTDVKDEVGSDLDFPDSINNLRIFGIRTIVLRPDSPECDRLRYPWNESGIILAPIIFGFPEISFKEKKAPR